MQQDFYTRMRVIKNWAGGSHKDCRSCGKKIFLWDFYNKDGTVKTVNGKPTQLFCGTDGCSAMWWNCPFCGEDVSYEPRKN